MDPLTTESLLALNRRFYHRFSDGFAATRQRPWSGWRRLSDCLRRLRTPDEGVFRVLDLGCGNARFARFLAEAPAGHGLARGLDYVGLDSSGALLAQAADDLETLGRLASPGFETSLIEAELGPEPEKELARWLGPSRDFDLVVLFGVLHHIPGETLRHRLLAAAARRLAPGAVLAVSAWCLDRQDRFERKVLPWDEHNRRATARGEPAIDLDQLEPGDHLLTWSGDPDHPRYCHFPPDDELDRWVEGLAALPHPLRLLDRYVGDLPGDRDNLYLVWGG